jgi:AraC-like DNA-binding protein
LDDLEAADLVIAGGRSRSDGQAGRSIAEHRRQGGNGARELFLALLWLVRRHLLEDAPSHSTHRRAQSTWHTVHQFLEENFSEVVTRKSVARALGLHPNYLSALARQAAGQSFQQVLEAIRMQHAQRLLRETDLKQPRIAALCGFQSAMGFIKAFRRATGVTPGRFRKPGAPGPSQAPAFDSN